jgi:hypothetical protein
MDMDRHEHSSSSSSSGSSSSETKPASWSSSSPQPAKKRPAGRTKFRETRHPVFRGVRRRAPAGRWVCEVRVPWRHGARLWLGTFATPKAAALRVREFTRNSTNRSSEEEQYELSMDARGFSLLKCAAFDSVFFLFDRWDGIATRLTRHASLAICMPCWRCSTLELILH